MFTGLVETVGTVGSFRPAGMCTALSLRAPLFVGELVPGQSVAVCGACLTVTALEGEIFSVDVMPETLKKTKLRSLRPGARVNLDIGYDQGANATSGIPQARIPVFMCPSEANDTPRLKSNGTINSYPLNYGFCAGVCLVWNPVTGQGGEGVFVPNAKLRPTSISDGLSNTLCAAEFKTYTPYGRDGGSPTAIPPATAADVAALVLAAPDKKLGPTRNDNTGHTEWPDGSVHHDGFTTLLQPNTKVPVTVNGIEYDCDYNSQREGRSATRISYASVTARSFHTGLVNTALMDGSVRSVRNSVDLAIWRALGTRAGGEVISDY